MVLQVNEYEGLVTQYISYKRAQGLCESTLTDLRGRLRMIGRECNFECLADIEARAVEGWFAKIAEPEPDTKRSKRSARTRLIIWKYGHGFFAWLVKRGDLEDNPIDDAPRPKNLKRDTRRKRRSFTVEELQNLFTVASLRPLAEYGKMYLIGSKDKKRWDANPITLDSINDFADYARMRLRSNPRQIKRLEVDGSKWVLIYKTLLLTGLRWGELMRLTVAEIIFGENARIELDASKTKNGDGATIPLNDELQTELAAWINDRQLIGRNVLFEMPQKGMKRFRYDAKAAGIEMMDARGRGVDLHSMRRTFGTLLVRAGVNAKVTQAAMRHGDIRLTMDIYASCETSEVSGAVDMLPSFSKPRAESTADAQLIRQQAVSEVAGNGNPAGQTLTPEDEMILAIYRNRKQA